MSAMSTVLQIAKRGRAVGVELADEICDATDRLMPALKVLADNTALDGVRKSDVVHALFDDLKKTIGFAVVAKLAGPIELVDVDKEDRRNVIEIRKNAGTTAYDQLVTKAEALRNTEAGKKLTKEQAFAKVYQDPANRELVELHKREPVPQPAAVRPQRAEPSMTSGYVGIEAIAKRLRAEDPTLTPARAFAKAAATPEGVRLRKQDTAEHLGKPMSGPWADADDDFAAPEVETVDAPRRGRQVPDPLAEPQRRASESPRHAEAASPDHRPESMTPSLRALYALRDEIKARRPDLHDGAALELAMRTPAGRKHYRAYKAELFAGAHR